MSEPIEVVRGFCDLMVKRDPEALRGLLASDAVYQCAGLPASVGVDAVLEDLGVQFAMFPDSYEYRTQHIVASGEVVMTERLDMLKGGPHGVIHAVPVMGTFVVRDGKIIRWTDYYDSGLVGKMMTGEDYSDLVPSSY